MAKIIGIDLGTTNSVVAVMEGMLNGPGPAKLIVKDEPPCEAFIVTAVDVWVSMILTKPLVLAEKLLLTIGKAPAFSVPIPPVPLKRVRALP